jgi:hypothetical protein
MALIPLLNLAFRNSVLFLKARFQILEVDGHARLRPFRARLKILNPPAFIPGVHFI